jgi:hypothetical protein
MGSARPTDTCIASKPQRFLLGLVDCNPISKKGLDPLCNAWVPPDCSSQRKATSFQSSCVSSSGCDRSQPDGDRTSSFERRSALEMLEWWPTCFARLLCCFWGRARLAFRRLGGRRGGEKTSNYSHRLSMGPKGKFTENTNVSSNKCTDKRIIRFLRVKTNKNV